MQKSINIILLREGELDKLLGDLAYINKAIRGDKSPPVYRRVRKFKKMGVLIVNKGTVKLTTNPLLLASFEVNDDSIRILDFALLYQNKELHVISSICGAICERCPRLQACSLLLKSIFEELGICTARGVTPVEVIRFMINECLGNSKRIKMVIDMRDHAHRSIPDDGKYIIINTHKNSKPTNVI
ncbi:hypothetical protein [Caldivirga sp. UBA161]|uniref:hypothetical protein n=1 Tax=Caldivirga sp. UBA161 TaxID=1915569 RepID=UPI0025C0DDDE|nr:hypothetical protein [Caldivirga sp. UBA161]